MIAPLQSDEIMSAIAGFRGSFRDLDNNIEVDASSFAKAWNDLARQLAIRGLSSGHIVVVAIPNGPLFPSALAAVLSQGATPLLVHGSTPLLELISHARKVGASFILREPFPTQDLERFGIVEAEVVLAGEGLASPFASVAWCRLDADMQFSVGHKLGGIPLHPTSGSTGESKIAARGGYCCMEEVRHIIAATEVQASDRFLVCVPMSHAYGYGTGMMVPIAAGATILTQRAFNPRAALRALFNEAITVFPAAPAMLDLMLKMGDWPDPPPRLVLAAGSPLAERTAEKFYDKVGTRIRTLYGTTETGTISICTSRDAEQPGCVGRPLAGVEIQLRPPGEGVSDAGGVGLLHVRSSSMMSGYFSGDRDELQSVDQGWFNTGDLAKIDAVGAIYLVGRVKDIINVSGLKVIPSEVETVLATIEGVVEVSVYAGKHQSGSDIVKAALVTSREVSIEEVIAHCDRHLVGYKRPEIISFLSSLPRTPSGKLMRELLP